MSYNFFLKLLLVLAILFPSALTAANQQPKLWNIPHEPLKFVGREQNNMLASNKVLHAAGAHYTNALLAKAYLKVGKNKEAREVAAKGYRQAMQSSNGDEDHEIVARVSTVLAQAECRLGNLSKA